MFFHISNAPQYCQALFAPWQPNHLHPSLSSTVLQFEVKNTSFTSHFSPLGIANCGKTLPGGRFKGRRRKTRRSKNCHSLPYSHITTTLSHSIAKTEKQVKTGRNSSSAKTNCSHSHTTIWEDISVFQCFIST